MNDVVETNFRFFDGSREPCKILSPIYGFAELPIPKIEESVEEVRSIIPNLNVYVSTAKEKNKRPSDGLTVDESAAIALYTMEWSTYTDSLYYKLNTDLRYEERKTVQRWFKFLRLIVSGLYRLEKQNTTVYRGVQFKSERDFKKYQIDAEIIWWGFSSCSTSREVSTKPQFIGEEGCQTLFEIHCLKGIDIANHSFYRKEREVLLLPGTRVRVTALETTAEGLRIIHLKEIAQTVEVFQPIPETPRERGLTRLLSKFSKRRHNDEPIEVEREDVKRRIYFDEQKSGLGALISGKSINDHNMQIAVEEILIQRPCRSILFQENRIGIEGWSILMKYLAENQAVRELSIAYNPSINNAVAILGESLIPPNNQSIKILSLVGNSIKDDAAVSLARMLTKNQTLERLNLSCNSIGDTGFQHLMVALRDYNKTVAYLTLDWNQFGDDSSLTTLIDMLKMNETLIELTLQSCKFSQTAIKQLKTATKKNPRLKIVI